MDGGEYVAAGTIQELRDQRVILVNSPGVTVAVFFEGDRIFAVDNRCPHMGFPLHRGSLRDGILTCHWHHARFDVNSGCTFDLFADDIPSYQVQVVDGRVYVACSPRMPADLLFYRKRLRRGLDMDVGLIQAKALLGLLEGDKDRDAIICTVAEFASKRLSTWGEGLVRLACVANLLPVLSSETGYLAIFYATRQISREAIGAVPHRLRGSFDGDGRDSETLSRWLDTFVKARHADGIERTISTALRSLNKGDSAGLLSDAAAVRLYADGGHLLDMCNKAYELIRHIGPEHAESQIALLAERIGAGRGEEEGSSWRHPVDLVSVVRKFEDSLPEIIQGKEMSVDIHLPAINDRRKAQALSKKLIGVLLGDDGHAVVVSIREVLVSGIKPSILSAVVAYAAGLRLARFSSSNDVGDWVIAQHTFIFANAVDCSVRRNPTLGTVAAIAQAALAVHADRFLNVPPAKLPDQDSEMENLPSDPQEILEQLLLSFNGRSILGYADLLTVRYLRVGGSINRLVNAFTYATVREDFDFHCLQVLEAAVSQTKLWSEGPELEHLMVAVARSLSAHCPTQRRALSTAVIARRLHRGQALYVDNQNEVSVNSA